MTVQQLMSGQEAAHGGLRSDFAYSEFTNCWEIKTRRDASLEGAQSIRESKGGVGHGTFPACLPFSSPNSATTTVPVDRRISTPPPVKGATCALVIQVRGRLSLLQT
jgi:hypothetical protein